MTAEQKQEWTRLAVDKVVIPGVVSVVMGAFMLGGILYDRGAMADQLDDTAAALEDHVELIGHPVGCERQAELRADVDRHEKALRLLDHNITAICIATGAECER